MRQSVTVRHPWWVRALPPTVVVGTLMITTPETYALGRDLLGLPHPVMAAALPVVVDGYAITALRFGRDLRAALGLLALCVAIRVVTHTLTGAGVVIPVGMRAVLAVAVVAAVVTVAWRVHVLISDLGVERARAAARAAREAQQPRTVPTVDPVPETAPQTKRQTKTLWPEGPEGDEMALRWLTQADPEHRTAAALAEASGRPRTGAWVRRMLAEWESRHAPHVA